MDGWNARLGHWRRGITSWSQRFRWNSLQGWVPLFLLGVALSFTLAACNRAWMPGGTATATSKPDVEITLVGYAVPKAAHDAIIPKFQEKWKAEHGQNVFISQSYGGSGAQTRAIIDGLDADVAHLAIGADVDKLVQAGYVSPEWQSRSPNQGIVGETVAAIVTRAGNPKNIQSFADLTRADVTWVTADPKTSGGARWNYFALWHHAKRTGASEAEAIAFVTKAYQNVAVLARDARESTDAFATQGQGDALLNYENEVILANQKGKTLNMVIPEINLSIDTPATIIDRNVDRKGTREVAQAFVEFLFTPEAQREFAKVGFRPLGAVAKEPQFVSQFPPIKQLGTIDDYGGWQTAQKAFEDGGQFDQIRTQIAQR